MTPLSSPASPASMQDGDNVLTVAGQIDVARAYTEMHMNDGQILRVPTDLLARAVVPAGHFQDEMEGQDLSAGITVPLLEERLSVGKRTVVTGRVRLEKTVQEFEEALNEPLAVRTFDVERVLLNRPVESAPAVRQEGDTTIYPVVEEQLILTKQLILKEEVRVTKRETERKDTQVVTLKREHLSVERIPMESE